MTDLAPIAVFAYKRPHHLKSTLETLKRCPEYSRSKILVFCDGAKGQDDRDAVETTRRVAQTELGSHAEYHLRDTNAGLAASIIAGVSEVLRRYGRAIVLEDDLELSEHFLGYMNAALVKYDGCSNVYQVSGQLFHTPEFEGRTSALFLPFTSSWGWGTWLRAWTAFDPNAHGWTRLATDPDLRRRFNLDGCYDFSTMLERQLSGHGDSWAIRWYWSVFRNEGLVCFPPVSLVRNTGMDGSGTHGRGVLRKFRKHADLRPLDFIDLPDRVAIDPRDLTYVQKAIWRQNGGWIGSAADKVRRRLFKWSGRHA